MVGITFVIDKLAGLDTFTPKHCHTAMQIKIHVASILASITFVDFIDYSYSLTFENSVPGYPDHNQYLNMSVHQPEAQHHPN